MSDEYGTVSMPHEALFSLACANRRDGRAICRLRLLPPRHASMEKRMREITLANSDT